MTSITQTVPGYIGGISEQADQFKFPGQVRSVLNAIPDVTNGLYKRPGSKRIGTSPLANVQTNGSWFHYYRDETEGSYIGQIASDGTTRIWSCNDGTEKTVHHGAIPWVANTAYEVGDKVQNGANIYVCDTDGTSAGSGGPTGTGANISDNTTRWDYEATVSAATASIKSYLTPSSATATEDIQALTINDTTFLNNRTKVVATTGTTPAATDTHYAYLELLRTENGRQYGLNAYSSSTTTDLRRATRVEIAVDTLDEGNGTGDCPGVGTQVFSASSANSYSDPIVNITHANGAVLNADHNRKNLIFRVTTLGQQGKTGSGTSASDYQCSYNREVQLLHGGENWEVGDTVTVKMTTAKNGTYTYNIRVEEIETVEVKGTINGGVNGICRPAPTPFDADTAVTVDTILGGIQSSLNGTGITSTVIGNGLYLTASSAFNIEVVDQDLMRVMQDSANDVTKLPLQCKLGYIVKIQNTRSADEDDYYVKFSSNNNLDGSGSWIECAKPGIVKSFDTSTMPHTLTRMADGSFLVKAGVYTDRVVGDDVTNAIPTFVGQKINKIVFFRNRICFLSGENVIASRPGELSVPAFWSWTALSVSAIDPIDIACSSTFPSELFDAVELNVGLVVFSTNQQFLLISDAEIMNPDTAKLKKLSIFNYNEKIPPIALGITVGFVDSSGKYSRFNELLNIQREGEPDAVESSKVVPTLLPKDIDMITHSRENGMVLFGKTGQDEIQGWRFLQVAEKRGLSSWFKWKLNNPLRYHFIVNDTYYHLDTDNFLQSIELIQSDTDLSIDQDNVNYQIHLDNYTTVANGSYNASTNLTTFTNQATWIPDVTTPNGKLVLVDTDSATARVGRYAECTLTGNSPNDDFTVPGDWSREVSSITVTNGGSGYTSAPTVTITNHGSDSTGTGATATAVIESGAVTSITIDNNGYNYTHVPTISFTGGGGSSAAATAAIHTGEFNIGYLYDYQVDFPRIYVTKQTGENRVNSDINSSLVIHRLKLNCGKIGLYETTLTRVGKDPYTELYESTILDEYDVSDAPYLDEYIQAIPVYERNTNVDITLKSTHPSPATLRSMSWEGDYSPKYYRRVG